MKTKLIRFSIAILCIASMQTSIVYASSFPDIPYDHPLSTPVSFLESLGVVEGYPDGTFRPDQQITRTEFLKIVLEGTNVPLDVTATTSFPDINENEWYGPYIKKAKKEGWIQGYPDGTFQPLQPIKKVEALKIVGEVQQWEMLDLAEVPQSQFDDMYRYSWYAPYVHFAEKNNLISEETYLNPGQDISRGYMSELLYLSIIRDVIAYDPSKTAEDKINDIAIVDTPTTYSEIAVDYFDNVTFSQSLPTVFYKDEIYILKGEITNGGTYSHIFAFLAEDNGESTTYTNLTGEVTGTHFEIPLIFREAGQFQLGVIPGNSGESKINIINVLDGVPIEGVSTKNLAPTDLAIDFNNDKTTISWDGKTNDIFRICFIQEDTVHCYFTRDVESMNVAYNDFKRFVEGPVEWRVYGAEASNTSPVYLSSTWAQSVNNSFSAIEHHFKLSIDEAISYSTLPEKLSTVQKISVSGTTQENIFGEGAIITPSGSIDHFDISTTSETLSYFGNVLITAGSPFSFNYFPSTLGTYILEINGQGGSAIVNVPVYIGNGIPLIPDFFDLQDPTERTYTLDLARSRDELLLYINAERANHGLGSVSLREDLNGLAQMHTNDMVSRNYFAHINPEDETPDDRRTRLGITTEVGENLAEGPTLYFSHQALMRSAIHRANILNPDWTALGIGLTLDQDGSLIIAEEFSHDPWTEQDLAAYESQIRVGLNQNRTSSLVHNQTLQDVARSWSDDMINQNFFSFTSPSGINLIDTVRDSGIDIEGQAYILQEGSPTSILNSLLSESDVLSSEWQEVGIGLKQDNWSNLYLTIIYTHGI